MMSDDVRSCSCYESFLSSLSNKFADGSQSAVCSVLLILLLIAFANLTWSNMWNKYLFWHLFYFISAVGTRWNKMHATGTVYFISHLFDFMFATAKPRLSWQLRDLIVMLVLIIVTIWHCISANLFCRHRPNSDFLYRSCMKQTPTLSSGNYTPDWGVIARAYAEKKQEPVTKLKLGYWLLRRPHN